MWARICKYSAQSLICIPLSSRDNPFLLESLRCVLHRFGLPSQLQDISLTLKNEGGFYFMKDGKQTKTGFGSSSTTVIATIASLLLSFGICSFAFISVLKIDTLFLILTENSFANWASKPIIKPRDELAQATISLQACLVVACISDVFPCHSNANLSLFTFLIHSQFCLVMEDRLHRVLLI